MTESGCLFKVPAVYLSLSLSLALTATSAPAQYKALEGTPEKLGTVDFRISCNPEAQRHFTRGVSLYHSYYWPEARKSFSASAQRIYTPRGNVRSLMKRMDLDLETIILLDRVQKRQPITKEEHKCLKADKLVEGRFPNPIVAAQIAAITGEKGKHILNKGFDDGYYRESILKIIRENKPVSRKDIDGMLMKMLPDILSNDQKLQKIHNLMMFLAHKQQQIKNVGSRGQPKWVVTRPIE